VVQLLEFFGFLAVLLRAATLSFQTLAAGGVVFLTVVARRRDLLPDEVLRPCWKLVQWCALGLAGAQIFFILTNSFVLVHSADLPLSGVMGANFVVAGTLAILAAVFLILLPASVQRGWPAVALVPAGMMIAASVMTSHSAARMEDRLPLIALTAVHQLATASWIGGLPYLLISVKRSLNQRIKERLCRNFSLLAKISVGLLAGAGLAMSVFYVGSLEAFYGTSYGIMVAAKVALFGCLLALGGLNVSLVRKMGRDKSDQSFSLLRFGEAEIGIGLSVILAAAALTSQPPGSDLTENRVTAQEVMARMAPRWPRLKSPELRELSAPTALVLRRATAAGMKLPESFVPGQNAAHDYGPGDIAWSEYNHNWAGLIVFLMGLLAFASRSRIFPWAKHWPLMFLGLAVFLFLRADPENWPLGPIGFWESFADPEVLQHRVIVLLIIAFAVFQWAVETGRVQSQVAALVFPAVCALGGAALLTHSHALGNIKEESLVELSHASIGVLGVMAGWSRWLELRLPAENGARTYLARLWPICFILVGAILLDYHES
jgi:putative copper resistance protein D